MKAIPRYLSCYLVQDACKVGTYTLLRRFNLLGINDDEIQVAKIIGADHTNKNEDDLVSAKDEKV